MPLTEDVKVEKIHEVMREFFDTVAQLQTTYDKKIQDILADIRQQKIQEAEKELGI